MSKYKFDSNKHGDLYIMKKDDPNASLMDINRIIVKAEEFESFLSSLGAFLVEKFQLRYARQMHTSFSPIGDMTEAWAIIANVSNGDWTQQSQEWQESARAWRDLVFHKHYCATSNQEPPTPILDEPPEPEDR